MRTRRSVLALGATAAFLTAASCGRDSLGRATDTTRVAQSAPRIAARPTTWNPDAWQPPAASEIPNDSTGASIRRGLALLVHTRDSLPRFAAGSLTCTSCHLQEGRRQNSAPLSGVFARYPRYMDRSGAVIPIEDRVNYCFTRSLAGSRIPADSREMQDIVAYLAFLSQGVPVGAHVSGEGMPKMPTLSGDSAVGRQIFAGKCARCHGQDGAGVASVPALWGARSFSIGASMARQERAASFVRYNMPFDSAGTLTDQQAYDVAAFITSMPRTDQPGKTSDWPGGGTPSDVPYATSAHQPFRPPHLLPRADPEGALVPAPVPIARRRKA